MKFHKSVKKHFEESKCSKFYFNDNQIHRQIDVVGFKLENGDFEKNGNDYYVEYGWSDAQVVLRKNKNGKFKFINTIAST